ncbi:MAG: HRDC domain-containing protein [Candidatus Sericytochromatia bacterium]|nr:HRDC domain-containing protein [Candidatus Sericytochromatia bacterium]
MKQVRIFTCPYAPGLGNFDDRGFQMFIQDKQILEVNSQFFMADNTPCWSLVVQYQMPVTADAEPSPEKAAKTDYRDQLQPEEQALFDSLRTWRAEKAKAEGIPPYVVCTNRQLVQLIQLAPGSLSAFDGVENFGPSRIEKYGPELIQRLRRDQQPQP